MDSTIVGLTFRGECVILPITMNTKFTDLVEKVIGMWHVVRPDQFFFRYSAGPFRNCCVQSTEDVMNMKIVASQISENLINVAVIETNLQNGDELRAGNSATLHPDCSNFNIPKENSFTNNSNIVYSAMVQEEENVATCSKRKQTNARQLSGGGLNLPIFDVNPQPEKKVLLSSHWGEIITGNNQNFVGGVADFRRESIKYTTQRGSSFAYQANNKYYVYVVCTNKWDGGCDWFIRGAVNRVTKHFVISNCKLSHKCHTELVNAENTRLGAAILASLIINNLRNRSTFSANDAVDLFKVSYGLDISYLRAYRAVELARDIIFGSFQDSFNQLKWYCEATKRTNPGSVVLLENEEGSNRFNRAFFAYNACVQGFKNCRPMLFIDGTCMKGKFSGTILSATAKDGNNGLFPMAFAIVQAETLENWQWFLEILRDNLSHSKEIFYISDRNCGLMSAFQVLYEKPRHFYCLYHLYTNLRGLYSGSWGNSFRNKMCCLLKKCAYSPNKRIFAENLALFKEAGGALAETWIENLPFEKWVISYSPHIVRYGEMTSNAVESFNKWIKPARSLPITYMVDFIRLSIMRWFVERREKSEKWTGALCPRMEQLWNSNEQIGRTLSVIRCPNGEFEAKSNPTVTVNLKHKTCTCYQWQVLGFPCYHAIAVIRKHTKKITDVVEPCFFTTTYCNCYAEDIHALPGTEMFECKDDIQDDIVLPPIRRNPPGRRKKNRIPSYGEFPKRKSTFCSRCCKMGKHDNLTCALGLSD